MTLPLMLRELNVVEQRYRVVLEVLSGIPVFEAAERYGVARQTVHRWTAVELDRVVPPSGNLWLAGQQIWLGPAMTGHTIRFWAGLDQVHVLLDGHRIKTLPSRLDARDLARLATAGATSRDIKPHKASSYGPATHKECP